MRKSQTIQGAKAPGTALFFLILFTYILSVLPVSAAPTSALSGNQILRAGDLLTLTLTVSGNSDLAAQCDLHYDPERLSYLSSSSLLSDWTVEPVDKPDQKMLTILAYDNTQRHPLSGTVKLFTVSFRVSQNLSAGTSITVTAKNLSLADGANDTALPDAAYSIELAPPKSGDATLASLSVSGTSLTPGFSPDVTEYTAATVPFAVSSLSLDYKTNHSGASVKVSGNNLKVGDNTVILTVTAENGVEKAL